MDFPKLIEPVAGLEGGHAAMLEEWRRAGETPVPWVLGFDTPDFPAYIELLHACGCGEGLAG